MNRLYQQLFVRIQSTKIKYGDDELANPHRSQAIERMTTYKSKTVKVLLKRDKKGKTAYLLSLRGSMFPWRRNAERSSRAWKSVDTFILPDVNTWKSNHNAQINDSDQRGDSIAVEKSPLVDEREKICQIFRFYCIFIQAPLLRPSTRFHLTKLTLNLTLTLLTIACIVYKVHRLW